MLNQLVKYAEAKGLASMPGFRSKEVRWAIHYDMSGKFLGVTELGNAGEKGNRGRTFPLCPNLTQPEMLRGGQGCRHFLVDSTEVVALHTEDTNDAKVRAKHAYFVDLLEKASAVVPELHAIGLSLNDDTVCAQITDLIKSAKGKKTDSVTIAILERKPMFLVEDETWHPWWQQFRLELANGGVGQASAGADAPKAAMRCLLTGELVQPLSTQPKISGLSDVGGLAMGDAFACFDKEAFASYGLEQGANAAMSEEIVSVYNTALNNLIRNSTQRLVGTKMVYWYAGTVPVPKEADPIRRLNLSFDDDDEQNPDGKPEVPPLGAKGKKRMIDDSKEAAALLKAREFFSAIRSGKYGTLDDDHYYMLALSGASGRVMVRNWIQGQYLELAENIEAWFDDLRIVRRDGSGLTAPPKFKAVLGALVRVLKDIPASLETALWNVAIRGEPFSDGVMSQALTRAKLDVIQDAPPNHARMGLLKAYWVRRHKQNGETCLMNDYLNEDHPDPAYHCGRLMAVLADLQYAALGDVGAGVVQRYYAAASATPDLVFGRLLRLAQFHLNKLGNEKKGLSLGIDGQIAQITSKIKMPNTQFPRALTLREQSLFALGYYQQKAYRKPQKTQDGTNANEKEDQK
jgi:CRISPR-associated protein Csd1